MSQPCLYSIFVCDICLLFECVFFLIIKSSSNSSELCHNLIPAPIFLTRKFSFLMHEHSSLSQKGCLSPFCFVYLSPSTVHGFLSLYSLTLSHLIQVLHVYYLNVALLAGWLEKGLQSIKDYYSNWSDCTKHRKLLVF